MTICAKQYIVSAVVLCATNNTFLSDFSWILLASIPTLNIRFHTRVFLQRRDRWRRKLVQKSKSTISCYLRFIVKNLPFASFFHCDPRKNRKIFWWISQVFSGLFKAAMCYYTDDMKSREDILSSGWNLLHSNYWEAATRREAAVMDDCRAAAAG